MRRKEPTDKEIEDLPDGYIEALERSMVFSAEVKHKLRDDFAIRILAGICAGDWQFAIQSPQDWDKQAVRRAYELADAMLKEREIDNV